MQTGSNSTFTVIAAGTNPLSYQWHFNNVVIPGATGSSYIRVAAQTNDMGAYSVFVTNAVDGILSSNAFLTIASALQPEFAEIIASSNTVRMLLLGEPGTEYAIEVSTNLPAWTPHTNILLTEDSFELIETVDGEQRFYRAVRQ